MKKGFTLIELLVVVLIIGILSAIALPQYTKAVEKSRMAEAIQMLHQIHHACELYELAGNDCNDGHLLENSDIGWPSELTTEDCPDVMCFHTKDWQFVDNTAGDFVAYRTINGYNWNNAPYHLQISTSLKNYSNNPSIVGHVQCINIKDTTFCQKICGAANCYID